MLTSIAKVDKLSQISRLRKDLIEANSSTWNNIISLSNINKIVENIKQCYNNLMFC
jgi:hypothetical protein